MLDKLQRQAAVVAMSYWQPPLEAQPGVYEGCTDVRLYASTLFPCANPQNVRPRPSSPELIAFSRSQMPL